MSTLERSRITLSNRVLRVGWNVVWIALFRPSPRLPVFWAWRRLLLRIFRAKIGRGVKVYPSARIWAPWNLELCDFAVVGPETDVYSVAKIVMGPWSSLSQYSYLCTATHDIEDPDHQLIIGSIVLEERAWVAADAYVGPGVTIGKGAVVGARSSVYKDVEPWAVVGGNPAKKLRQRVLRAR